LLKNVKASLKNVKANFWQIKTFGDGLHPQILNHSTWNLPEKIMWTSVGYLCKYAWNSFWEAVSNVWA